VQQPLARPRFLGRLLPPDPRGQTQATGISNHGFCSVFLFFLQSPAQDYDRYFNKFQTFLSLETPISTTFLHNVNTPIDIAQQWFVFKPWLSIFFLKGLSRLTYCNSSCRLNLVNRSCNFFYWKCSRNLRKTTWFLWKISTTKGWTSWLKPCMSKLSSASSEEGIDWFCKIEKITVLENVLHEIKWKAISLFLNSKGKNVSATLETSKRKFWSEKNS
jgi:hypothetical protein